MSGNEVYHSIQQEANKESGMNNKPYDQWTNTERDHYNIIHEKIKTRTVNTVLKNAMKTDGKDQGIYKALGYRVVCKGVYFPSGISGADNFNCHSAFIIDNHEEIQELKKQVAISQLCTATNDAEFQKLKKQMAAMTDDHEEIQKLKRHISAGKALEKQVKRMKSEFIRTSALLSTGQEENRALRRELGVMRSEIANLKAASVLDDIDDDDDDEDEIAQPVTPKEACESLQEFIRACEPKVSATIKKKMALGISADACKHSDRHYEQVCRDWLS
jgi:hypothetical protein